MYVKCINQTGDGDRIYDAGDSVEFGSVPWWPDNQGGVFPKDAKLKDLTDRIGVSADSYDFTLIHPEPFGYKDGDRDRPFWKLRWAKFEDADGVKLVVGTGPMFIVGDNGKTIDRAG
jgi:hypothetical protein